VTNALRLAFGTLSVLPVGHPAVVDRRTWRGAIVMAPFVGIVLGVVAAAVAVGLIEAGASSLLAAVAAIATLALLTRGLHLDGLTDVADGLGSGRSPADARAVMKRSDIGPFGVVTLVFILLAQVSALAALPSASSPTALALTVVGAALLGRAALTWSCRQGVLAAEPGGLGSQVAESVPVASALAVLVVCIGLATASGLLVDARFAVTAAISAVGAVTAAELWRRHCSRRFGGITGDVLGSVEQVTFTGYVLFLSLGV
jgi:adenosylcobinamide-GDP ribazoletransferase